MNEELIDAPGTRGRESLSWAVDLLRDEPALALGMAVAGGLSVGIDWPSVPIAVALITVYPSAVIYIAAIDQYAGREPDPSQRIKASTKAALTLLSTGIGLALLLTVVVVPFGFIHPLAPLFVGLPIAAYLCCRTCLALPAAAVDGALPIAALRRGWSGFNSAPEDVAVVVAVVVFVGIPAVAGAVLVEPTAVRVGLGIVAGVVAAIGQAALAYLYIDTAGD